MSLSTSYDTQLNIWYAAPQSYLSSETLSIASNHIKDLLLITPKPTETQQNDYRASNKCDINFACQLTCIVVVVVVELSTSSLFVCRLQDHDNIISMWDIIVICGGSAIGWWLNVHVPNTVRSLPFHLMSFYFLCVYLIPVNDVKQIMNYKTPNYWATNPTATTDHWDNNKIVHVDIKLSQTSRSYVTWERRASEWTIGQIMRWMFDFHYTFVLLVVVTVADCLAWIRHGLRAANQKWEKGCANKMNE